VTPFYETIVLVPFYEIICFDMEDFQRTLVFQDWKSLLWL